MQVSLLSNLGSVVWPMPTFVRPSAVQKILLASTLVFFILPHVLNAATLTITSSNPPLVMIKVYPADSGGASNGTTAMSRAYSSPTTRVWLTAPLRSGNNYFVKWQRNGVDFGTASTISLLADANYTLTAVYETPSCAGIDVNPGTDNIKNAVAAHPAGTTFCIKAGIHRFTVAVTPARNQRLIGETGAILNGSKVLTSFVREGRYWVATGQTQEETRPSVDSKYLVCISSAPQCVYHEKVFRDNQELWQENSLSALGTGEFYFDYAGDRIYLYDDPMGHTIEATTGSGGLVGFSGSNPGVVVKNLIVEKFGGGYVPGESHSALKGSDWVIENNEFRNNTQGFITYGAAGIARNNYVHHNGQYGVLGGALIEGNVVSFNNTDGFHIGLDAGGSKFLHTTNLTLRGNVFSDNIGRAIWADYDNVNSLYENNIIERNTGPGIDNEVNCAATARYNVLRDNNSANTGRSLSDGGQINARMSRDFQIYGNDITATGVGVDGIALRGGDAPYNAPCGASVLRDVSVHDNIVRLDRSDHHGLVGSGDNIQFTNNTYIVDDLTTAYFQYNSTPTTRTVWQGTYGQDVTGSFIVHGASGTTAPAAPSGVRMLGQ